MSVQGRWNQSMANGPLASLLTNFFPTDSKVLSPERPLTAVDDLLDEVLEPGF